MQIEPATILLIAGIALSAGMAAVLGVFLTGVRKNLRQATLAHAESERGLRQKIETVQNAHQTEMANLQSNLIEPFKAGRVITFVVSLNDDRLSDIRLTGRNETLSTEALPISAALELVHPDDRSMIRNALIESLSRQRPLEIVFRALTGDKTRYFHGRGRIVRRDGKGAADLLGTIVEITELQKARGKLMSWIDVLESVVDLIPVGITAVDDTGTVTVWNTAISEMTGIQPGAVIGCDSRGVQEDNFKAVLNAGRDSDEVDGTHEVNLFCDDRNRRFSVSVLSIHDRQDSFGHEFRIVRQLDPVLSADNHSIEMEALGRLTSGIAHDFANLVHLIIGYTDILAQDLAQDAPSLPPLLMDDLKQVQDAGARADELVRQLVIFSSPDKPSLKNCNLNDIIDDFMGLAKRVAGENVSLRFHPAATPPDAIADPIIVEKTVLKLLLRIRRTIPDGGVVAISTRPVVVEADWPVGNTGLKPGNYVKLAVSCATTGWMDDSTDEGDGGGSATVSGLMAALGGAVNIHESPDVGTTVSLYFRASSPATDTRPVDDAGLVGQEPPPKPRARPATILVVEDDAPVRKLTAKALRKVGHTVLEACDGREALELFESNKDDIELLITDVIMPGMNGREVCDRINKVKPDLPVLFCSGYSSDLLQSEYMLNIHGLVIQKPYRSADLLATAARLLG